MTAPPKRLIAVKTSRHRGALSGVAGIAASGLLLAGAVGVYAGVTVALNSVTLASVTLFGMAATKIVATGLLAYNIFAGLVAPFIGLTLKLVGLVEDKDKTTVPKPGETPKHPYGQIRFLEFNRKPLWYYRLMNLR